MSWKITAGNLFYINTFFYFHFKNHLQIIIEDDDKTWTLWLLCVSCFEHYYETLEDNCLERLLT